MKLHYAEVLNPRKVCALAKFLGAPVEYLRVDLAKGAHMTPAFRALNPNAKVPVLEDGATILWESDAILVHLARAMGSDLWPTDERQVDVIRWMAWNQVHFQPHGGMLYFQNIIKKKFMGVVPDAAKVEAAEAMFRTFARVLDAHLAGRATLVGDDLTIADFTVAGVLPYRDAARIPLDEFPNVVAWAERLDAIPAWRDPFPAAAGA